VTVLVVAGTDTGVGKTVVVAALAAIARARGDSVAVVKPVQTGVAADEPGDVEEVRRLAGVDDLHELARLPDPLAPATAARVAHAQLPAVADAIRAIERLRDRDLVLVEGSGGLLVHLDDGGGTLADLALGLAAPVLVVVRARLGTLNHTALTCEALTVRGVECAGIVVGEWPEEPDLAATCNLEDLPMYAAAPLVGCLPQGAGALEPETFLAVALDGLTRSPAGV
jgi:dethiobiotin synthetase